MSRRPALGRADGRPRVHIWPAREGVTYSHGPTGSRMKAASAGAAVDLALAQLCADSAVVIVEPSA